MARSAEYARRRLSCEMYYPSDVAAGETWGTVIAELLMGISAFVERFDRAAAELRAAGVR